MLAEVPRLVQVIAISAPIPDARRLDPPCWVSSHLWAVQHEADLVLDMELILPMT